VDDNHALAIFHATVFAKDALSRIKDSHFKLRPILEATPQSKQTFLSGASNQTTPTEPAVPRPKTTSSVARRLIGNALQMPELQAASKNNNNSNEFSDKDLKRGAKQNKKDYWDE